MLKPPTPKSSSRSHDSGVKVVERLQEITAPDEGTPTAVEIVAQVDLTKLSKQ
jgi:hypothetical protein